MELYPKTKQFMESSEGGYADLYKRQGEEAQIRRYGGLGQTSYRSNLDRFFDALSVGTYAVQGAIHGAISDEETILGGFLKGIRSASPFGQDYREGEYTFGQNLEELGWKPTSTFGRVTKGVIGLAGDILLDPLTYATLGASAVVKGTGTKVAKGIGRKAGFETVAKTTAEEARSVLTSIGKEFSPKDVADLMTRADKLKGIKEGGKGIGVFGKQLVSADTLRAFGDRTIAPYFNALTTKARQSSKFSTKGTLIRFAKDDPEALAKTFDFFETANEKGYDYEKMRRSLEKEYEKFSELPTDVQEQVTKLVEDKDLWEDIITKKPLSQIPEGEEAFGKIKDYIDKYGIEDPEMKKVMDEIAPKFKPNEDAVWRAKDGDIPVKILGETQYKGDTYYKAYMNIRGYEGVNYIPESAVKSMDEVAEEISQATVKEQVQVIKEEVTQRKGIDLTISRKSYDDILRKTKRPEEIVEGIADETPVKIPPKRKVELYDTSTLVNEAGEPVRFFNIYSNVPENISRNIQVRDGRMINFETGELIAEGADLTKPMADITKTKVFRKSSMTNWMNQMKGYSRGLVKAGTETHRIEKYKEVLEKIRDKYNAVWDADPILADLSADLKNAGKFNDDPSFELMQAFFDTYSKGNIKGVQGMMHRMHKDYPKALTILDNDFGHYKGLPQRLKAKRMNEMYRLLNNPKELNTRFNELFSRRFDDAVRGFSEMEQDIAKYAKNIDDAEFQRTLKAEGKHGYANADEYIEAKMVERTLGKKEVHGFEDFKHADHRRMFYDDDLIAERNRLYEEAMQKSHKELLAKESDEIVNTQASKTVDDVRQQRIARYEAYDSNVPNTVDDIAIKEPSPFQIEESVRNLSRDIEAHLTGIANREALIQRKLTEYRQALTNETEFENFMRGVWGDEKVDYLIREHSSSMLCIDKLALHDEDVIQIAKDIRDTFRNVKEVEQSFGLLDKTIQEGYVAHVLTPEAKGIIDSLSPQELADAGIRVTSNNFKLERKYVKGTVLPNGVTLEKGTIDEINGYMKDLMGGNKMFATKISDIYLARMQKHYKLLYEDAVFKDMNKKFGTPYGFDGVIKPGHTLVYSAKDVKRLYARLGEKEIQQHVTKQLGINWNEIQKLGNNFIRIDKLGADRLMKEGYIKVTQMPTPLLERAEKLMHIQMGQDIDGLLKYYDTFLHGYKKLSTIYRPTFYANNIKGNMFNNYLNVSWKSLSPRFNKASFDIAKGLDGKIKLGGVEYTYETLRREARKQGVTGSGFFQRLKTKEEATTKLSRFAKITEKRKKLEGKLGGFGSFTEDQGKFVNFMANLDNGKSFREAGDNAIKYLFDYDDLTKFESSTMQRIFPFYTWMKKNSLLQLEEMAVNPEKYLPIRKAINEIEGMSGDNQVDKTKMPEWAQDWVQLPGTVRNEMGNEEILMWSPNLPYQDVDSLPNLFHPVRSIKKAITDMSPAIKVPAELLANENFFFEDKIDKGKKVMSPTGTFQISPQLNHILNNIPGYSDVAKLNKKKGIDWLIHVLDKGLGSGVKSYDYQAYHGGE